GHGGARREAERLGVPFLGEVPLDIAIREKSDSGSPVVATVPDGVHAEYYRAIAKRVRDGLAAAGRATPQIVIEAQAPRSDRKEALVFSCTRFDAKRSAIGHQRSSLC